MVDEPAPPAPGPETPRPGRAFQGAPHPRDEQPVSGIAERVGPAVVGVALTLTFALLAWMALAPTAIAGAIEQAPFAVPATVLLPPDDAGCLTLVAGDGSSVEHCDDAWSDDSRDRYVDAYFDTDGRLLVGEHPELSVVDPATGDVVGSADPTDPHPEPDRFDEDEPWAYTRGDRVYVSADGEAGFEEDPPDEDLVLDLAGPWGFRVTDAALSPDGRWVLARTNRGQVVAAPVDGSAPPYVWVEVPSDRWVDLRSHVRWDR